jgi:hypothetical protein
MYNIFTNASQLAADLRRRTALMESALDSAFKNSLIEINRAALRKLDGSNTAAPGSYPVPNRTGHLFREQNWEFGGNRRTAFVFNRAVYATDIHEGKVSSARHGRRPFLDDAAASVDVLGNTQQALRRSLFNAG